MYKEEVHPRNKLIEPSVLIGELTNNERLTIFYDFEARVDDCPLLLCPPHDMRVQALHQAEREEKEAREARYAALKSSSISRVNVHAEG